MLEETQSNKGCCIICVPVVLEQEAANAKETEKPGDSQFLTNIRDFDQSIKSKDIQLYWRSTVIVKNYSA